jgi:hypothetical protein
MTSPIISSFQLPLLNLKMYRRREKAKRRNSEGDDTVTIEDTSDDEDGETLHERFQLRSRFNRPRLPDVPLIVEKPASLEASLPAPPRRPRNVAQKRTAKKLKITESTAQEVSSSSSVVVCLHRILHADS